MVNKIVRSFFLIMAAALVLLLSCRPGSDNSQTEPGKGSSKPAMANPAAARCINDGFLLEPVLKNGITKEHVCVNPRTGKRCEVWAYYRNECSLD